MPTDINKRFPGTSRDPDMPCQKASVSFGLRKYQGKSGIKKLFNLLVEEFGEKTAGKRQIALLFALLDSEQPVENIKALMGETDNSSIVRYGLDGGDTTCEFFSFFVLVERTTMLSLLMGREWRFVLGFGVAKLNIREDLLLFS